MEDLILDENGKLKKWIKEIFIRVQEAWNQNNPDALIYIESDLLFERDAEKMRKYVSENKKEIRKDIVVTSVNVCAYEETEKRKVLEATLKSSMERYVVDLRTKEIVDGIKDYQQDEEYLIVFGKRGEKQTPIKCVGCGADITFNSLGKCEYCGNYIYSTEYDWVIEEIKKL